MNLKSCAVFAYRHIPICPWPINLKFSAKNDPNKNLKMYQQKFQLRNPTHLFPQKKSTKNSRTLK